MNLLVSPQIYGKTNKHYLVPKEDYPKKELKQLVSTQKEMFMDRESIFREVRISIQLLKCVKLNHMQLYIANTLPDTLAC